MSHLENLTRLDNKPAQQSLLDRGVHPEPDAEYPGRSSPQPVVPAHDGHPPRRSAAAKPIVRQPQKVGPFGLKLTPDDFADRLSVTVRRHGDLVEMLRVPQIERTVEPEKLASWKWSSQIRERRTAIGRNPRS